MRQNYHRIDEGTYKICYAFKFNQVKSEIQQACLDVHQVINVTEAQTVCNITGLAVRFPNIFKGLKAKAVKNKEEKISEDEYNDLVFKLCQYNQDELFKEHNEEFSQLPIRDWLSYYKNLQLNVNIKDVSSVSKYVSQFNKEYGEKVHVSDLRERQESIRLPLKEMKNMPNNLQMAIAQTAVQLLRKHPHQVHVIAGGQGKSRVTAVMALLSLEVCQVKKVYLVFSNQYLLNKDQDDFQDLWLLTKCQERVEYHADMNFEMESNDLVIFDEADEYIYGDTGAFLKLISNNKCICLTATRGGSQQEASEKQILNHIGLKVFDKVLGDPGDQQPENHEFQPIDLADHEDVFKYLQSQRKKQAMLVYAT